MAVALTAAVWLAVPSLLARQIPPGAPSNFSFLVDTGGRVAFFWTHSTGTFTHYVLEAGFVPNAPAIRVGTDAFNDGNPYGKMRHLVPSFSAGGVGQGDYYVRVRGANGAAESAPSNEVLVPVRNGCYVPGAPTNFTQIVRGTSGFLMWNPGNGGQPTNYILLASFSPGDPNPPIAVPLGPNPYFTLAIPQGAYYVKMIAANACGQSGMSNELLVQSPSTTAARTPDPPAGQRLPQPFVRDLVFALAQQASNAGLLNASVACPQRSGGPFTDPIEARKTQPNPYINFIVDNLRQVDQRFGYNAKPTRSWVPAIIAGDEIAYHYGADPSEGSPNAFAVDVLGGHCTGVSGDPDRHSPDYRVFYDEFIRWTGAGRF
jgi:hypothetical protein